MAAASYSSAGITCSPASSIRVIKGVFFQASVAMITAQAFMVFDHIYALTGGGPGTATETLAFLNYQAILNDMRFGYGSALSVLIFLGSLAFALLYLRTLGLPGEGGAPS